VTVPAYPRASRLKPEEFAVQVTLLPAVFRPIASVEARAVVRALWLAVIWDELDIPKVIPLLLTNARVPLVWVCVPAAAAIPPEGAAAERDRVSPALLDAVVPLRLVKANVGLP
jgi:hypothetical protein